jgi:hypothetical protein
VWRYTRPRCDDDAEVHASLLSRAWPSSPPLDAHSAGGTGTPAAALLGCGVPVAVASGGLEEVLELLVDGGDGV